MKKIIEKKPMQMYGIDDFISEMKDPMPYVDIMARIHYLTGYNKSALIMLHQHAEWIVPDGKASQYYLDWIKPLPKRIPKEQEERISSVKAEEFQYIFFMDAMDALINGRDIQDFFLRDDIRRISTTLIKSNQNQASHRATALVHFYLNKVPDVKSTDPLMKKYNFFQAHDRYRLGDDIGKNDIARYVRDHETCGVILQKIGNQKAIDFWKAERAMIKRKPKFMDRYDD
jgi:hypothetical protein